jgi:hypothetical protein
VSELIRKITTLVQTREHLVPWLLLALVGGATLAVLQILVVRILH